MAMQGSPSNGVSLKIVFSERVHCVPLFRCDYYSTQSMLSI